MPAAEPVPLPPVPEGETPALVPIEITWDGISALYKSFFQERIALTALAEALAPWVDGPVQLHISYDQVEFTGSIRVVVPPGALRSRPSTQEGLVDLAALSPVTVALATYRDDISGQFDVRLASFVVALDFFRGPVHCRFGLGGDPPPDGRTVSPCPTVNGQERCGRPVQGGVRFDDAVFGQLEKCLGS